MQSLENQKQNSQGSRMGRADGSLRSDSGEQWSSLEQLADAPEFRKWLHQEFAAGSSEFSEPLARRQFIRLMGASLALTGLGACTRPPQQKIVSYLEQPENLVSGRPLFFATAIPFNGSAVGVLVESNEGRPTKIEGNPTHPLSLGATSIFEQASLLTLYDPDRSKTLLHRNQIETWESLAAAWLKEQEQQVRAGGRSLRFLVDSVTSPTAVWQIGQLQKRYPEAKWHQWEPISRTAITEGYQAILGEAAEPEIQLSQADVIVAFDSDFLFESPFGLADTRAFAKRRNYEGSQFSTPNQLYVAEPSPTITGSMAEERLAISGRDIGKAVRWLASRLGLGEPIAVREDWALQHWIDQCATRLQANHGRSLVIAGLRQPPIVHQWVHSINLALGNIGKTVVYRKVAPGSSLPFASIAELADDLESGRAQALIILGGNPVFDAPVNLAFREKLGHARFSLHLSLYQDETSNACHWHVPENHFLESWSDATACNGTTSIIQPLIAPLYGGFSRHQLLALFLGQVAASDYELVRQYWEANGGWSDFEHQWRQVLNDGVVAGKEAAVAAGAKPFMPAEPKSASDQSEKIELCFHPDPTLWDGRFANNAWLQELPKPFTRITWDNPALVSPALAKELQIGNGDVIEIRNGSTKLEIPIWILPGQAKQTISLYLGGGRTNAGRVGDGAGFNAYQLRLSDALWFASNVEVRKSGRRTRLVSTQLHHSMQGREPVRTRKLDEFVKQEIPESQKSEKPEPDETLYDFGSALTAEHQWGMVINLNTCTGCNACVIACQSENNIPVVGKDQVWRGREMHWIRIDRYYEGEPESPKLYHQPVPCMHCETAPCELVCPVEATLHSAEGLNQQIYNRCIGTRYCSNNCPYKVRRFNFLQFADTKTPSLQLGWNPQVTVRSRGVMEKCTYCVQRIRAGEIDAERENRPVRDGEIIPACAQVCPAQAISFGDIRDANSRVSQLKASSLNYGLLDELNTRPRTTYFAKVISGNSPAKISAN
ncbi:MAG TPA: TAT-variant-translocated molybdopterin oxidoreductase [Chthoniobacterales bacterium]|nr:TAT-variant-translocated molybdopterin oxidoreductase [Chthoniobacterales bacterium]